MRTKISLLLAILCSIAAATVGAGDDEVERRFLAGAARVNITPPLGELVVGGWAPVPATYIHDELHVRCLVLDDGRCRLAFAICDNVGIPREVFDLAKQKLHASEGMLSSNVLMASTHTHSATTARGASKTNVDAVLTDYQRFVAQRICDGIRKAMRHLEPAQIGWGSADEPSEVFNRRWHVNDASLLTNPFGGIDQVRMNPPRGHSALDRPAGPVDPEVAFLSIRSTAGHAIALLANYSLHYVGGVPAGEVSADYFGYFARTIAAQMEEQATVREHPQFVAMLSNGTSGDVNNIDFLAKNRKQYASYEKMQEVAEKVAGKVMAAHANIEFRDWVPLAAAAHDLQLEVRQPSADMLAYLRDADGTSAENRHRHTAVYAKRVERLVAGPKTISAPLQVFKIGGLGIAAIPFETFAEIGLELKQESPFASTFTIELANGSFGYLPTPRQHRLGGYETWLGTNNVEIEASEKIIEVILELFDQVK